MELEQLRKIVIGCCYAVQKELGVGFVEKVYENALLIALKEKGIECRPQVAIDVYFQSQIVGEFYADILVDDCLILELKAVRELLGEHQAQLINYLKASKVEFGLLINFGKPGIEIRRLKRPTQ